MIKFNLPGKLRTSFLTAGCILLSALAGLPDVPAVELRVGSAEVDLTPAQPGALAGSYTRVDFPAGSKSSDYKHRAPAL